VSRYGPWRSAGCQSGCWRRHSTVAAIAAAANFVSWRHSSHDAPDSLPPPAHNQLRIPNSLTTCNSVNRCLSAQLRPAAVYTYKMNDIFLARTQRSLSTMHRWDGANRRYPDTERMRCGWRLSNSTDMCLFPWRSTPGDEMKTGKQSAHERAAR